MSEPASEQSPWGDVHVKVKVSPQDVGGPLAPDEISRVLELFADDNHGLDWSFGDDGGLEFAAGSKRLDDEHPSFFLCTPVTASDLPLLEACHDDLGGVVGGRDVLGALYFLRRFGKPPPPGYRRFRLEGEDPRLIAVFDSPAAQNEH